LVIIEAAATGLPSIVTDVDALPEVVKDGISGFVVADRNEGELARMLERVVIDTQQFASMRENCMLWSREFNWDACARKAFGAV
jgi:glycosyltransferase involved in cell wall biosynthesis